MAESARQSGTATTTETAPGLLDQIITNTKQTQPDRAQELVKTLVEQALTGTVTFDRNLTRTIDKAITAIDAKMSAQLNAIMHDPKFLKLEGSWRGLHYLVQNSETGTSLKLRVLNISKRELGRDLSRAIEFDQSQLFKKIYENEFGTPGGEPYGALIGDYEWTNHPDDIETLRLMSNIAAGAFAPFITAAGAGLFGFDSWTELSKPRDLAKIFDTVEFAKWRSFRDSDDARFVNLVMPRVIARLPYGKATKPIDEFGYEEAPTSADGKARAMDHDSYCWSNAAYVMGARLTDAFARYGFCTSIRGAEAGGKVENLPAHTFTSDDGDIDTKCPTEIGITDRREFELSNQGFLPLCHYKNTDYAVFFGGQTVQKPKKYDRPEATANAAISARLPYIMASSRFAHYLKVMARDKIGSFMEARNVETWLNRWIQNYVNPNEDAGQDMKARFPLREAKVEVKEIPGKPGSYNAVAYLRPWLQMEELTTSLRMVASIPQLS
ncbi:type VI secretion system contractile sheath large subunit [Reyranella sp.]|jgi:type VI secretion system protein ImpC|uniref:type VI secretion system contractile sheath large subunit n=1 Tax=Reyranella sp. TaxID=1929291 RepID=UPI002F94B22F